MDHSSYQLSSEIGSPFPIELIDNNLSDYHPRSWTPNSEQSRGMELTTFSNTEFVSDAGLASTRRLAMSSRPSSLRTSASKSSTSIKWESWQNLEEDVLPELFKISAGEKEPVFTKRVKVFAEQVKVVAKQVKVVAKKVKVVAKMVGASAVFVARCVFCLDVQSEPPVVEGPVPIWKQYSPIIISISVHLVLGGMAIGFQFLPIPRIMQGFAGLVSAVSSVKSCSNTYHAFMGREVSFRYGTYNTAWGKFWLSVNSVFTVCLLILSMCLTLWI